MWCLRSLFPVLTLALFLAFLVPLLASAAKNKKFVDCSPTSFRCGQDLTRSNVVKISYPFRRTGMPSYCGHPGFEVRCVNKDNYTLPAIDIAGKAHLLGDILYANRFFALENIDYFSDTCPQAFTNTTIDPTLFEYHSRTVNLTLYFNCPPLTLSSSFHNVPCLSSNIKGYQSYYSLPKNYSLPNDNPPPLELVEKCSSIIMIPIYTGNADLLLKDRIDFLYALQDGFLLNWTIGKGWCDGCQDSGGVCGFDPSSPNSPTCFCPDATTNGTCKASRSMC